MRLRITGVAAWLALASLAASPAVAADLPNKLRVATTVYQELMDLPDGEVPASLVDGARCIAVIPSVIKGAFGFGGRRGRGVLSCRQADGGFGPPAFVTVGGASFGLQIGGSSTDLVLFFMTDRGARALLRTEFTLGGDASVAAGPVGRSAQASTDLSLKAEIYSYAKARGLFAGISVEGAHLGVDDKSNERYYGQRLWGDEIVFDGVVPRLPEEAKRFQEVLSSH